MARTKSGLSLQRHREVGAALRNMHRDLSALVVEVGRAYPMTGRRGKQCRELCRALEAVAAARCALDSRLFEDHPQGASTDVYYGRWETDRDD